MGLVCLPSKRLWRLSRAYFIRLGLKYPEGTPTGLCRSLGQLGYDRSLLLESPLTFEPFQRACKHTVTEQSEKAPIRVLIADDHDLVGRGISVMLGETEDIDVVGLVADGKAAVSAAAELVPDVILMDLLMPVMNGVDAIRAILDTSSRARILAFSGVGDEARTVAAIRAGALGFVSKDTSWNEVVDAIRRAARGETILSPELARRLARRLDASPAPEPLTSREIEVLRWVARGFSNQRIAEQIHITVGTVRVHVSHILAKLRVSNRIEAALWALRQGLASLHDPDAA